MSSKKAYLQGSTEQLGVVRELLVTLLALLRGQGFSYQTSHWQVDGHDAYGNHLLFERLYNGTVSQVDDLAEKMVGYLGPVVVDPADSAVRTAAWVHKWSLVECHWHRGLASEEDAQAAIKNAYTTIKEAGLMTLGLDDFLMSLANDHESATYLLQQAMAGWQPATRVAARAQANVALRAGEEAPSAEGAFWHNPERYEVRQMAETGAVSNIPAVAEAAGMEQELPKKEIKQDVQQARKAPPTPVEIDAKVPGGPEFSTLNRFLVKTDQPVKKLPHGEANRPMTPDPEEGLDAKGELHAGKPHGVITRKARDELLLQKWFE